MAIKAILVDLDGVLRLWPNETYSIEDDHLLPRGSIEQNAFLPATLMPVIRGLVSDDEWRNQIANELQLSYPNSKAHAAVERWSEPVGSLDSKAIEVLSKIESNVKLVLATNATTRLRSDLKSLGINDLFFEIANSSEIGHVKPEQDFYQVALTLSGSSADEALFIDDTSENVEAARLLGIRSHYYTGVSNMEDFLLQYL